VSKKELELQLFFTMGEEGAIGDSQIESISRVMMTDLVELGVDSIERPTLDEAPEGAKGDPFTWGALALVAMPVVLPKVLDFIQSWVGGEETRKVHIKTPKGLEITFTPKERYSEEELLAFVDKLQKKKN
jgi:hypothetical protein